MKVRCIDNYESCLGKGDIYEVDNLEGTYCRSTDNFNDKISDVGGMLSRRFEPVEDYIVWSPSSSRAPTKTFPTSSQARAVARKMSEEHVEDFYVCKLETKYTPVSVVSIKKEDL